MGKEKSPGKRFCEECGRLIESKRPGVTLCRNCEKKLLEEVHDENDRQRRKDRKYAKDFEDQLFHLEAEGQNHQRRKDRRRSSGDDSPFS